RARRRRFYRPTQSPDLALPIFGRGKGNCAPGLQLYEAGELLLLHPDFWRRTEVSSCQSLGNGDFGGNLDRIRGALLAKVSPPATHQPAGPIPRHDRSKAGLI